VFDRLDADLAHALMCINAVKGVEIGAGFGAVTQRGTEHRDEMTPQGFLSNNAGGIVSVAREYLSQGEEGAVMAEVSRIGERVEELLQRAKASGQTPAREADAWARAKLVKPA
jgi:hypothetical protein